MEISHSSWPWHRSDATPLAGYANMMMMMIYYGLDGCPINKSQIKSLDFVLNSVFRKILLIKSYDVASESITFLTVLCLMLYIYIQTT